MLFLAGIIAVCAVVALLKPNSINVLSEGDRKKMNPKRSGRIAFCGLMATALILVILYIVDICNELVPIFVCIPCVLITAVLLQCSVPNK